MIKAQKKSLCHSYQASLVFVTESYLSIKWFVLVLLLCAHGMSLKKLFARWSQFDFTPRRSSSKESSCRLGAWNTGWPDKSSHQSCDSSAVSIHSILCLSHASAFQDFCFCVSYLCNIACCASILTSSHAEHSLAQMNRKMFFFCTVRAGLFGCVCFNFSHV